MKGMGGVKISSDIVELSGMGGALKDDGLPVLEERFDALLMAV
jgi:hypothetical protein